VQPRGFEKSPLKAGKNCTKRGKAHESNGLGKNLAIHIAAQDCFFGTAKRDMIIRWASSRHARNRAPSGAGKRIVQESRDAELKSERQPI
jgi:hypothetical protein